MENMHSNPAMKKLIGRLPNSLGMLMFCAIPVFAFGAEDCASDNPVITDMQQRWNSPLPQTTHFKDSFAPTQATLQPYAKAAVRLGTPALKAKRDVTYFDEYSWTISRGGDYWIAADSAVWIDVIGKDKKPLEPLTFNHGLRCAGIFKAVQFHLIAGTYRMVIASETTDKVKFSAQMAAGR
jgi:hypothetical protein